MKNKLKNLFKHAGFLSLQSSLISIAIGLLFGLVLLYAFKPPYALSGFFNIFTTAFKASDKFAKLLYQSAPLILTGLSVAFAFKTGLFNIGATGQYTMGAFFALFCAIPLRMPWYVCLLAAMIGGAIWGAFPGICKALFNVNEVITSIMFNWIGLFVVNLSIANIPIMLANAWGSPNKERTASLAKANVDAMIPKWGLDELFGSNYMNISIFIAIVVAVIVWFVLSKTTFGYELKACGFNKNASLYAGINAKRNIILSMVISGALAGLGGGIYYLSGVAEYTMVKSLLMMGFNGIPVALLASSNPLGVIFSALFISYIQVGGESLQPEFAKEVVDIIISVIIYLSAFSLLVRELLLKARARKKTNASKETEVK